jgi:hypothetical protein
MATLTPTITLATEHTKVFQWGPLTATDTEGHPIPALFADYADRTVHIGGSFNTGTLAWQGTNSESLAYLTLADPQGTAISKTAAAIEVVLDGALYQKPVLSGAGTDSITVVCVCRRGRGGKEI